MIRLTDHPNMTIAIYRGHKTTQQQISHQLSRWSKGHAVALHRVHNQDTLYQALEFTAFLVHPVLCSRCKRCCCCPLSCDRQAHGNTPELCRKPGPYHRSWFFTFLHLLSTYFRRKNMERRKGKYVEKYIEESWFSIRRRNESILIYKY